MTRNRKADLAVLEREYIYDAGEPPISYTTLAERHGLSRQTVAEYAGKGRWFERRGEFRKQLGVKAVELMGEQWVRFETAAREKVMSTAVAYFEKYAKALEDGTIEVSTPGMLGMAQMLRNYTSDATKAKTNGEEVLLDANSIDLHPDVARRVLAALEAGEPGPLAEIAPTGAEEPGED